MNTRNLIKTLLALFLCMFIILSSYLVYIVGKNGSRWFSSPYNIRIRTQKSNVVAGSILDRNGIVLAYSDADNMRQYNSDRSLRLSVAHIVGDNFGQTLGAEALYAKHLLGFDKDVFEMIKNADSSKSPMGNDCVLTIDAELCKYAYNQLDGRDGAIIVMNYKTGEILVSTSSPNFDPKKVEKYIAKELELQDGAMINRTTSGQYVPGSVFKIVTTVAALRYIRGVENMEFECTGELLFDKKSGKLLGNSKEIDKDDLTEEYLTLIDFQGEEHGTVTLKEAFVKSCNSTFAKLALVIGSKNLYKTAKDLGIGREFLFSDIIAYSGSYTESNRDYNLAWSGVGQYKDIVTPISMCLLTGAIANGGVVMEPRLLKFVKTHEGGITYSATQKPSFTALSKSEASLLQEYMLEAVKDGTGRRAAIDGYNVGGKTGTAEVTLNGKNKSHAWFCSFLDSEEYPFSITVVVELGGSGGSVAAPIARNIFKKIISSQE
ncbi:MAG: penicillin-binding protein 2 [Clostridiales bacterium]|nr:penicillin-binding protein 2 [Clostridiales bacterium]